MPTKKPSDVVEFLNMEGHEILRDPSTLRPSEVALLVDTFDDGEKTRVAPFLAYIEETCVKDGEKWQALYKDRGFKYIAELATAYVGELLGDMS
jgi:hypothetical protein